MSNGPTDAWNWCNMKKDYDMAVKGSKSYIQFYDGEWDDIFAKMDNDEDATVEIIPGIDLGFVPWEPPRPKCVCGAEKAKTTHMYWCDAYRKEKEK